ncbi:hypothetical protein ACHAXN_000184 [Cyclotella atomus]
MKSSVSMILLMSATILDMHLQERLPTAIATRADFIVQLPPNNQVQTTKPSAGLLLLEFAKALYMNISLTNAPSLRLNSTIFRKSARLR